MSRTVVGLFDDFAEAQNAVQDLVNSGFRRDDISVTANDAKGEHASLAKGHGHDSHGDGSGVATGAGIGAALGGVAGLLVGIGALAIPGIGPVLAAGPLAAALAGAGIGAVTGGMIGALTDLGVPEEDAHTYAEGVRRGGALVTLTTDENRADDAAAILNRHGAVDIDERAAQWRQSGWPGTHDTSAQPLSHDDVLKHRETYRQPATAGVGAAALGTTASTDTTRTVDTDREAHIPVVEENIQVGKREVERGGVRVYSRVTERPVQEQVNLREEHVNVERRPVDRPVTDATADAFQERTIEMTETAEVPVVSKEARVVEEVVVHKDVDQRTETVQDTVRRTDVDVEEVDNTRTATTTGRTTLP